MCGYRVGGRASINSARVNGMRRVDSVHREGDVRREGDVSVNREKAQDGVSRLGGMNLMAEANTTGDTPSSPSQLLQS